MSETYSTFAEVRARLDEILVEVRKKDLPLEKSLDLYEEAIKLGNLCAELVDTPDFTDEEAQAAEEALSNIGTEVTISGEAEEAPAQPEEEAAAEPDEPAEDAAE